MNNKILSTLNIGNNSYEIDDAFARQKIEEVDNNLLKINPVYSTSGSVVSFNDGADNLPLDELIVDINPVQDLHGYDHPWIGGGGKNLLDPSLLKDQFAWNIIRIYAPVDTVLTMSTNQQNVSTSGLMTYFRYPDGTQGTGDNVYVEHPVTKTVGEEGYLEVVQRNRDNVSLYADWWYQIEVGSTATDYEPYENICPITGWTGMNVQRCGKNLFDKSAYISSDITYHGESEIYTKKGIRVDLPSGTYTINCNSDTVYAYIYMFKQSADGNYVDRYFLSTTTTNGWKAATVTITNGEYLVIVAASSGDLQVNNIDLQIEVGSIATEYEPYNGIEIPISWESEAGTVYGGSLDVLTGLLTVTQRYFDGGDVAWNKVSDYENGNFFINTNPLANFSLYDKKVISSAYKSDTNSTVTASGDNFVWVRSISSTQRRIYIKDTNKSSMTAEEFQTAMTGVQFVYELATPITYQLTPHEVKTLLGQNNIFTDINSKNILVSYKASILKYIDKAKSTIFFGQCDPTSTATEFTAQIDGITEYFDGLTILLKNGVVASATGCTININGLGAKSMWASYELARVSTAFNVTRIFVFIYDSALDDGNGGFWMYQGKDTNDDTVGYLLRTNSTSLPVSSVTYQYRILFTSADKTHYVPANNSTSTNATAIRDVNQEKIDPFGKIVYYSSTTVLQAETRPSTAGHWLQNTIQLGYSFNRTGVALTLTPWKPVYVKATPYVDGSAIIDADEPITQDLPTTEDGKIYIHLANAYSATNVELSLNHPIYYYYNGAIRPWLGFTDSEHAQDIVSSVNGKTGTVTLTAEDVGAMEGMTILSYGHSTWAEFLEAYEANRIVYCKASSNSNPSTGQQGRMAFFAYVQYQRQGYSDKAEFQYYRSVSSHTDAQQGDQVFCYTLTPTNGGTWSVETRQASSRVIAGTGLASAYTKDKLTLSLDADYKDKIDTLWADYQSALIALDGGE